LPGLVAIGEAHYLGGMHVELNDEQVTALARELSKIIDNDRYPLSLRIVALKEISWKRRP